MSMRQKFKEKAEIASHVAAYIRKMFPHLDRVEFFKKYLSVEFMGALPSYSGRHDRGYQVTPVTTLTASSFCICYGYDQEREEWFFVATTRERSNEEYRGAYALLGGFINLDPNEQRKFSGEQPGEALVREISEETKDNSGSPVFSVDVDRLVPFFSKIDYRGIELDLQGTHNSGYYLELNNEECKKIRIHSQLSFQEGYSKEIFFQTEGEVSEVHLVPMRLLDILTPEDFRHPNEFEALRLFKEKFFVRNIRPDNPEQSLR